MQPVQPQLSQCVFAIGIEDALDVTIERPQYANPPSGGDRSNEAALATGSQN